MITVKEAVSLHTNAYVFYLMWDGERKVTYLAGDLFMERVFGNFKVESVEIVHEERNTNVELKLASMPVV